jgi:hypothetical protein
MSKNFIMREPASSTAQRTALESMSKAQMPSRTVDVAGRYADGEFMRETSESLSAVVSRSAGGSA